MIISLADITCMCYCHDNRDVYIGHDWYKQAYCSLSENLLDFLHHLQVVDKLQVASCVMLSLFSHSAFDLHPVQPGDIQWNLGCIMQLSNWHSFSTQCGCT